MFLIKNAFADLPDTEESIAYFNSLPKCKVEGTIFGYSIGGENNPCTDPIKLTVSTHLGFVNISSYIQRDGVECDSSNAKFPLNDINGNSVFPQLGHKISAIVNKDTGDILDIGIQRTSTYNVDYCKGTLSSIVDENNQAISETSVIPQVKNTDNNGIILGVGGISGLIVGLIIGIVFKKFKAKE